MASIETMLTNSYLQFLIIVVGSVVLARIIHFVIQKYVSSFAKQTKSDIDDIIVGAIIRPLYIFMIVAGLYWGLKVLPESVPYLKLFDDLFFVFSVFIVAMTISRIFSSLVSKWFSVHRKNAKTPRLVSKIVIMVVYIVAIITILGYFNVEITPMIATLGIGGLAVGLALQNTLSNLFAGVHIISDRPVTVGDFVEIEGGISGYVEDIGWRSTKIRTLPNTIVIVPNAKLAESTIINTSLPQQEMSIIIQCGVSYESDLEKVEKVTIAVAKKIQKSVPGAIKTFQPFIRYHTFADSNINFSIILRVHKYVDKYLVTHQFIKALKERYDKEHIEISWPIRKIYYGK
jgi:small-conductance mechanosensitive channel